MALSLSPPVAEVIDIFVEGCNYIKISVIFVLMSVQTLGCFVTSRALIEFMELFLKIFLIPYHIYNIQGMKMLVLRP